MSDIDMDEAGPSQRPARNPATPETPPSSKLLLDESDENGGPFYAKPVYLGRNFFLAKSDFQGQKLVTVSFGPDGRTAFKFGPYPQPWLAKFFAYYNDLGVFVQPAEVLNMDWVNNVYILNAHVDRSREHELEFTEAMWWPLDRYINSDSYHLLPLDIPARPYDVKDVWILAHHLRGHHVENALYDHIYEDIREIGRNNETIDYNYDADMVDYIFEHKL